MKKEIKFCLKCGSYDIKELSTGEILCQNKNCMAITKDNIKLEEEENVIK